MREAADLERDMVRAVEALGRAVEFLRHDAEEQRALADCAQEGLAAARRVLTDLRAGRTPPRRIYTHGDPGE